MKAMVLCAGYGTRLGDLTREMPKPMLDLGGHPLLAHILAQLGAQGFDDVAVNLHFRPDLIRDYFGDGASWGVRLTYSVEPELLGTAGGVRRLDYHFRDTEFFLVHYGDILHDQDLGVLTRTHLEKAAWITLLVHQRARSNSVVQMSADGRVTGFWERPTTDIQGQSGPGWVNSGVFLCDPRVLDLVPAGRPVDFPRDVFPGLVREGRVFGVPLTGYRCAVDSPQRLEEARQALADGRWRSALVLRGRRASGG